MIVHGVKPKPCSRPGCTRVYHLYFTRWMDKDGRQWVERNGHYWCPDDNPAKTTADSKESKK